MLVYQEVVKWRFKPGFVGIQQLCQVFQWMDGFGGELN